MSCSRLLIALLLLTLVIPACFALFLLHYSLELALPVDQVSPTPPGILVYESIPSLLHCSQEKGKVTAALLAGKLSLLQAIQAFRRLNEELDQSSPSSIARPHPISDEQLAERVLSWAGSQLRDRPERSAVLHRLEDELHQLFPHYTINQVFLH